jgi:hypothetical protein
MKAQQKTLNELNALMVKKTEILNRDDKVNYE